LEARLAFVVAREDQHEPAVQWLLAVLFREDELEAWSGAVATASRDDRAEDQDLCRRVNPACMKWAHGYPWGALSRCSGHGRLSNDRSVPGHRTRDPLVLQIRIGIAFAPWQRHARVIAVLAGREQIDSVHQQTPQRCQPLS